MARRGRMIMKMKPEKPKMSDIAKALNISTISVSRALAGQDGVSDELRRAILLKADEMGYLKPRNPVDYKILVLHQKPFIQDNSNYSHMLQGIAQALQKAGCEYDMEFVDKESQFSHTLPNKIARGSHYHGVLYIGNFESAYVDFLSQRVQNHVLYTGYSPSADSDCVWYNFNNGAYKQCKYLIQRGHVRIGFAGNSRSYVGKEKLVGIISALEDHDMPVENDFFICADEGFEEIFYQMIRSGQGPTAIICHWDYTAIKLIKYLHEKGLRVPDDLSIIGSGNTEMASLCIPALTTLELHIDYACETAVALLIKRLGRPEKPAEYIQIGGTLIERDSVKALG